MKKLFVILTLIVAICSASLSHAANRYVTLLKDADGTTALTQSIAADEVAFILRAHFHQSGFSLSITKGAWTFGNIEQLIPYNGSLERLRNNPFVVAGPCTITLTPQANNTRAIVTIKISPNPNIMGVKQ